MKHTRHPLFTSINALLAFAGLMSLPLCAEDQESDPQAEVFTLRPTSLSTFGYTDAELAYAQANGLVYLDLPAVGSGLQYLGGDHYLAVTDRGPSVSVGSTRIFPLPRYTPTIVLMKAGDGELAIEGVLPIVGQSGVGITGIPNSATEDSTPFLNPATRIPFNPSGMDIEDVHTLPGGGFILVEEYSPSIVILSPEGVVLRRYTPASKTLPGADYPVSNTLPDILKNRRSNRGFEALALSPDGRTGYTMTQSPLGPTGAGSPQRDSRVVRIWRFDLSDPLNLQITGEFAVYFSPVSDYPSGGAQRDLKVSGAAWVSPDRLIVGEVTDTIGIGGIRLILVDLKHATNLLGISAANTLDLEDVTKGPSTLGVIPGTTTLLFQEFATDASRIFDSYKLEGLTIVEKDKVAISNDNDFGIGDILGLPSRVTVLKLSRELPEGKE